MVDLTDANTRILAGNGTPEDYAEIEGWKVLWNRLIQRVTMYGATRLPVA